MFLLLKSLCSSRNLKIKTQYSGVYTFFVICILRTPPNNFPSLFQCYLIRHAVTETSLTYNEDATWCQSFPQSPPASAWYSESREDGEVTWARDSLEWTFKQRACKHGSAHRSHSGEEAPRRLRHAAKGGALIEEHYNDVCHCRWFCLSSEQEGREWLWTQWSRRMAERGDGGGGGGGERGRVGGGVSLYRLLHWAGQRWLRSRCVVGKGVCWAAKSLLMTLLHEYLLMIYWYVITQMLFVTVWYIGQCIHEAVAMLWHTGLLLTALRPAVGNIRCILLCFQFGCSHKEAIGHATVLTKDRSFTLIWCVYQ